MIEAVITSRARVRVLARLLLHPDQSFYGRQLAELEHLPYTAAQRELAALSEAGILTRRRTGNRVYYTANRECPIYADLRSMLLKTAGLADVLREALEGLGSKVRLAFVYGSLAKGDETAESDVDLMVVGDAEFGDVVAAVTPAQERLGREVNPTVYPVQEFRKKAQAGHHFVTSVLRNEKVFVIGDDDELATLASG